MISDYIKVLRLHQNGKDHILIDMYYQGNLSYYSTYNVRLKLYNIHIHTENPAVTVWSSYTSKKLP